MSHCRCYETSGGSHRCPTNVAECLCECNGCCMARRDEREAQARATGAAEAIDRIVALVKIHGEGEARACESHARASTGHKGRVSVKRMHTCAANQTRATMDRILRVIEETRDHGKL